MRLVLRTATIVAGLLLLMPLVLNARASATFSASTPITLGAGAANNGSVYPSTLNVVGLAGTISKVSVTIKNFSHTFPDDVGIVLVGPTGAALLLMDGAGDDPDV